MKKHLSQLTRFSILVAILFLYGITCFGQTISLSTLLDEMVDRSAVTQVSNYTCKQASSYDRGSTGIDEPGWFANGDASQFVRKENNNGREEWVLMDEEGPGAIVRWWITAPHYKNNLYIYIDGNPEPAIVGNTGSIIGGEQLCDAPLSSPRANGRNLYLPIPYSKHIKVTCDQMPLQNNLYYQINYRTYPEGSNVESFTMKQLEDQSQKVKQVNKRQLDSGIVSETGDKVVNKTFDYESIVGQTEKLVIADAEMGVIRSVSVKVEADDIANALRNTLIVMEFSGERTVYVPIGDFFGSGVGVNPYKTWYTQVDEDGTLSCFWEMPIYKNASIYFEALGEQPVNIELSVVWRNKKLDLDNTLFFHSNWRREVDIETKGGDGTCDWNYIDLVGRGNFVGDVLALLNRVPDWWGEGDEKIYVDNEKFPSHFGTGTEDYYGYAWCTPEFFEAPFHAQPRAEGPSNYGHTTNLRFRSLDTIPFTKAFQFDIEVWHWTATKVDYAATTFWYGDLNHATATTDKWIDSVKEEAAAKVTYKTPMEYRLGNLSVEELPASGRFQIQGMGMFAIDGNQWRDNKQFWWTEAKVGDRMSFKVNNLCDGAATMVLGVTKAGDYGKVQFYLNGKKAGNPVDLFNEGKVIKAHIPVAGFAPLAEGIVELGVEIVGKNEKAVGFLFGLDSVEFHK